MREAERYEHVGLLPLQLAPVTEQVLRALALRDHLVVVDDLAPLLLLLGGGGQILGVLVGDNSVYSERVERTGGVHSVHLGGTGRRGVGLGRLGAVRGRGRGRGTWRRRLIIAASGLKNAQTFGPLLTMPPIACLIASLSTRLCACVHVSVWLALENIRRER